MTTMSTSTTTSTTMVCYCHVVASFAGLLSRYLVLPARACEEYHSEHDHGVLTALLWLLLLACFQATMFSLLSSLESSLARHSKVTMCEC